VTTSTLVKVRPVHIDILVPVFNDWESVEELILRLDQVFAPSDDSVAVVMVDDGSTLEAPRKLGSAACTKVSAISVLKLKRNLGHQRALAVGLCYIAEKLSHDVILIMDGDGQDKPEDALRLLEKMKQLSQPTIVFSERTRRSESFDFRFSYSIYKILHYVLTGFSVRVGNFSVIPAALLPAITIDSMLWNHYAASVMRARLPVATVPTERGKRLKGESRLNFVGLVVHGLSALACYGEIIGVRLIIVSGILLFLAILTLGLLIGLKLFTTMTVPGWTSLFLGLIIILALQIATLVSNFTMQIISGRSVQPFLPARDYSWFVSTFETLYKKES
jgi:polyisoprenyl-phosphate glycosyltransferase